MTVPPSWAAGRPGDSGRRGSERWAGLGGLDRPNHHRHHCQHRAGRHPDDHHHAKIKATIRLGPEHPDLRGRQWQPSPDPLAVEPARLVPAHSSAGHRLLLTRRLPAPCRRGAGTAVHPSGVVPRPGHRDGRPCRPSLLQDPASPCARRRTSSRDAGPRSVSSSAPNLMRVLSSPSWPSAATVRRDSCRTMRWPESGAVR